MSNQPGHDHGHPHPHTHDHPHDHPHAEPDATTLAALAPVSDGDLTPAELTRRNLLRAAGVAGGAAAAAGAVGMLGVTPAMAEPGGGRPTDAPPQRPGATGWLAGDHHIHTQYSSDAQYTVLDQAQHGAAYGLDWLVITDHGGATHARIGVDLVNPDVRDARSKLPDTLIFQGLEWNIPSAEHGTVFVTPGRNEVAVLKQFENDYDGSVNNASSSSPANERLAVAGVQWLGQQMDRKRVAEALFLANHPARNGIDSPHEIRAWRDADPRVAVGFEGAPGHQAAGLPEGYGPASNRGYYGNSPGPNSFADYPPESYRTWGGFDWFTATVGGLWDSLLAEGKPWTISANSDSHVNWSDTSRRPDGSSTEQFNRDGRYGDPVYAGQINLGAGDFWPGFYSRTHVGAAKRGYAAVMQGIRAGAVWVDHGQLVDQVEVLVRPKGRKGQGVTLGGTLQVKRGTPVEMVVRITPAQRPNWAQFTPSLNRVDLVRGAVDPRPARADRDLFTAPDTRVVSRWDTSGRTQRFELTRDLGRVEDPFYVRLRGTDGNVSQEGYYGADVDAQGPRIDPAGDADPWTDLWFYTNPVWVVPTR